MSLRGMGLLAVFGVAMASFGCSPSLEKGAAASPTTSSASSEIPSTREAEPEDAVGTTSLTNATLSVAPKPTLPPALWDHWDEPPPAPQTWGIEQPMGPDGF